MKLHEVQTSLDDLRQLRPDVLTFLVIALDFANELAFLIKAIAASHPKEDIPEKWRQRVTACQVMFYAELAAGKLYEFWRCIKNIYHARRVMQEYHDKLDPCAQSAYESLKKYFTNSDNDLKTIRLKYAFHSDPDKIAAILDSLDGDTTCHMIVSESYLNTFFDFASGATHRSIISVMTSQDASTTRSLVQNVVLPMIGHALHFAHGIGTAILHDTPIDQAELGDITVPSLNDLELPYFVDK